MSAKQDKDGSEIQLDASNAAERKTLLWVLGINFLQVIVAGLVGIIADSTGLLGAALDNLGDAIVYAVSIYAVGRTIVAKARVARLSALTEISQQQLAEGVALSRADLRRAIMTGAVE